MKKVFEEVRAVGMVKVFKDSDWNAFVAKVYTIGEAGKLAQVCSYESDSKDDAICTGLLELDKVCAQAKAKADAEELADLVSMGAEKLEANIAKLVALGMTASVAKMQKALDTLKASEVDLPTEADLDYIEQQAEVLAMQFNKGYHDPKAEALAGAVHWNDCMMFIEGQEPLQNSMYRLNVFVAGHDVEGVWTAYNPEQFAKECAACAAAGVGFSVEFK